MTRMKMIPSFIILAVLSVIAVAGQEHNVPVCTNKTGYFYYKGKKSATLTWTLDENNCTFDNSVLLLHLTVIDVWKQGSCDSKISVSSFLSGKDICGYSEGTCFILTSNKSTVHSALVSGCMLPIWVVSSKIFPIIVNFERELSGYTYIFNMSYMYIPNEEVTTTAPTSAATTAQSSAAETVQTSAAKTVQTSAATSTLTPRGSATTEKFNNQKKNVTERLPTSDSQSITIAVLAALLALMTMTLILVLARQATSSNNKNQQPRGIESPKAEKDVYENITSRGNAEANEHPPENEIPESGYDGCHNYEKIANTRSPIAPPPLVEKPWYGNMTPNVTTKQEGKYEVPIASRLEGAQSMMEEAKYDDVAGNRKYNNRGGPVDRQVVAKIKPGTKAKRVAAAHMKAESAAPDHQDKPLPTNSDGYVEFKRQRTPPNNGNQKTRGIELRKAGNGVDDIHPFGKKAEANQQLSKNETPETGYEVCHNYDKIANTRRPFIPPPVVEKPWHGTTSIPNTTFKQEGEYEIPIGLRPDNAQPKIEESKSVAPIHMEDPLPTNIDGYVEFNG